MKLFELTSRYEQILDRLDSFDAVEDANEIKNLTTELETLGISAEDKAVYYANNIRNLQAELSSVEDAIAAMRKRKESLESKIHWKSESLKILMEKTRLDTVKKSPHFVIHLKESRELLDVIDEKLVPDEYLRSKLDISLD